DGARGVDGGGDDLAGVVEAAQRVHAGGEAAVGGAQAGDRRDAGGRARGEHEVVVGVAGAVVGDDHARRPVDGHGGHAPADGDAGAVGQRHREGGDVGAAGDDVAEQHAVVRLVRLAAEHGDVERLGLA